MRGGELLGDRGSKCLYSIQDSPPVGGRQILINGLAASPKTSYCFCRQLKLFVLEHMQPFI